jgi:hypothetical protein
MATPMNHSEIARVQAYLRTLFGNNRVAIVPPNKKGQPVEVKIGDEFVGVVHRDEDEGEVSFSLVISILEEDLPTIPAAEPPRKHR